MDAEHRARMTAVFAWMQDSLRLARERDLAGMVIFAQADPISSSGSGARQATASWRSATRCATSARVRQAGPVRERRHPPLQAGQAAPGPGERQAHREFTRVIVFGSPQTRWIRAGIDASTRSSSK